MSCKWSLVKLSSSSNEKIRFVILAVRITASGTGARGSHGEGGHRQISFVVCVAANTHARAHTLTKFRQNSHTKTCRRCRTGTKCNENVKKRSEKSKNNRKNKKNCARTETSVDAQWATSTATKIWLCRPAQLDKNKLATTTATAATTAKAAAAAAAAAVLLVWPAGSINIMHLLQCS